MKKIVVMTGAGMSAESGISTFRDAGGLWEGHDVMEVASPMGYKKNPALVIDFYNQRRRQLFEVEPNAGHKALTNLEEKFQVDIITQNVDDLHERAGSSNVLHLHGELRKVRSLGDPKLIYDWDKDLSTQDCCEKGHPMRPHIVWFGEMVPMLEPAIELTKQADLLLIIGTSLQVYPAAGLAGYAQDHAPIYYIDPRPSLNYELRQHKEVRVIEETAANGVPGLVRELLG